MGAGFGGDIDAPLAGAGDLLDSLRGTDMNDMEAATGFPCQLTGDSNRLDLGFDGSGIEIITDGGSAFFPGLHNSLGDEVRRFRVNCHRKLE